MGDKVRLAIIGTGNIGRAMAVGLAAAGRFAREEIILTRRKVDRLADLAAEGFQTQSDNRDAVQRVEIVIVAVGPQQLDPVLQEIRPALKPDRHLLISVVSGASIEALLRQTASPGRSSALPLPAVSTDPW